ncbi:TonB-dependent receptor [Candidatus Koribacter versatilis Ellin345]|uniref:TonB-dependent receptor n=1 Tax=Koribacter versatilis (strain Ellin345) TaxID=204669 RepID=Q1IJV9_KORVE|nr:carboxypeptidase regulatory-like domain-containing protein [Candidatus Koribacter versatilis]ABF42841.1 TonB-dependent receptor [Candidatus Koribacter versatilis Ellin345]
MYRTLRSLCILVLLSCLSIVSRLVAQDAAGTIFGTITDLQGSVVPDARVRVTNGATAVSKETVTGKDGSFRVLDLPVGKYTVTAESPGFAVTHSEEKPLQINQNLRIDIRLQVGTEKTVVDVTGEAAGVETVNSTLGQSVTSRPLVDLPLNGRDVLQLALLQPGVTETNEGNTGAGSYSIGGGRSDSVTFLLDGGINNDLLGNEVVFNPNPDAIAEFRILQNNYTAEYGRNGGGVISVVTKSGGNNFHGSGFEFLRNDAFNANSYFNKLNDLPRNVLKRNQYGGTIGGPIIKNRLFFFVSYQGQRLTATEDPSLYGNSTTTTVFTNPELQNGDFGGDPNVANFLNAHPYFIAPGHTAADAVIDPAKFDPVAQKYIGLGLIPSTSTGELNAIGNQTDNRNELSAKIDFQLDEQDKIGATFGGNRNSETDDFRFSNVPGSPVSNHYSQNFLTLAYTRTFSNSMLNEFRFTAQRTTHLQDAPLGAKHTPADVGVGIHSDDPTGVTVLGFDNGLTIGPSLFGPTNFASNTFSYSDNFSWVRGKHSWKFGAGFTPYQNNTLYDFYVNGYFQFNGTGSGNSLADFLLGVPTYYIQYPQAPSNIRSKNTFLYAQDEWHVSRRLVLNLGLRYEYSTPKIDTEGRSYSIIPGQQSTVFPNAPNSLVFPGDKGTPTGANFPDKNDFGPRLGFAYDVFGDGKTSLRGGVGLFYDILKGEDNLQFNGQPPFFSSAGLLFPDATANSNYAFLADPYGSAGVTDPFPSKPVDHNLDFGAAGFLPFNNAGSAFFVDPHLRTPYTYQYNLSLEREIARNTIMDVSYVGSDSHKLTSLVDINPFDLSNHSGVRLLNELPANQSCDDAFGGFCFASMPEFKNASNAVYNALEASVTRQPTPTWKLGQTYFTLAYTYAHNIDNASGFRQVTSQVPYYNGNQFRASADQDIHHRLTFSGGWDFALDQWWPSGWKRLTQGWSVFPIMTWRTGFPYSVFARFDDSFDYTVPGPSGAGDPALAYANVVGSTGTLDPRKYYSGLGAGAYWINPNSFSNANEYDYGSPYGDFARNSLRGPHETNLDFEVAKTTKLTESLRMQLRAEMFNVFNHAEFRLPDTNITSPSFGQILGTYDPRIIQFAVRFTF